MSRGTKTLLFRFTSLLRTLKQSLKSTGKRMYSSLHLSKAIKYMTFLLFQERSPFIKYVLPVTLDVSFIFATK